MTLWGGRFEEGPGDVLWEYTTDHSDRRLLLDDIDGSIAHVTMLGKSGVIPSGEVDRIVEGLHEIRLEALSGEFPWLETDEDVHTAVERRLGEKVGDAAGKLHTARSRNDQSALDLRLYLKRAAAGRVVQLHLLAAGLSDLAEIHAETPVATYTHLQQAQVAALGHHLLAYAWMALRDTERFTDASRRIDVSPLGAGASAGTSLGIDPTASASLLGMASVFTNSLDAVGSRDHVAEYVFCCAQAMTHLSRLAEEIILWSTTEFAWARLDDQVSTGSSALPHKRNPDIAELVRGRAARVTGDLMAMLALQKGLSMTYNRDLQEDKRIVFDADDVLASSLTAITELLAHVTFDPPAPAAATGSLDLAEALVRRGVPFREAHHAVGRLVLALDESGRDLGSVTLDDLTAIHEGFQETDLELLNPSTSIDRPRSPGAGTTESVRSQVAAIREIISGSALS